MAESGLISGQGGNGGGEDFYMCMGIDRELRSLGIFYQSLVTFIVCFFSFFIDEALFTT